MGALSREQVTRYLYDAGFRGEDLVKMVAIAGRESGYDPSAHRTDRPKSALSGDMGLFQINYVNWPTVQRALGLTSKEQLFDPAINAKAARVLFESAGLQPWSAGPGGWTAGGNPLYGTNVDAARSAVNTFLDAPQKYPAGGGSTSSSTSLGSATSSSAPREPLTYEEPNVADPERTNTIADYKPPETDPAQQKTLTNLLQGFGIEYPNAPRATPQLLAYLRGLGVTVDTTEEQFASTRADLQRKAADKLGDLAVSDQRRRYGITNDSQSRGALVSGATNSAFARQMEDYARQQAGVETSLATGINQAERAKDTLLDQTRQRALETVLGEETNQEMTAAQRQAEIEAARRAQAESDLQYERQKAESERARQAQIALYNQAR